MIEPRPASGGDSPPPAPDPASAEPGKPPPPLPPPAGEDVEMGGEAPCQLHRFWDPEE